MNPMKEVELSKLKPAEWNPRIITEKNFKKLQRSLRKRPALLWKNPIYANKDGIIYSGNMRYRAAESLGWKTIPAVVSETQMSEIEMHEESIILNHHLGEDQEDGLAEILHALNEAGSDVELLGLPDDTIGKLLDEAITKENVEAEDAAELVVPKNAKTKRGDLIQLGKHILMCGDATNIEDVKKLMGGGVADMVFTDPPYNVDYEGKTEKKLKIANDKMDDDVFYRFLLDAFRNMSDNSKEGAACYICHADSEGLNFRKAMIESGFLMKQCIVWVKNTIVLGRQDYQWQHEPILVGRRGKKEVIQHEPILYGWKDGAGHFFTEDRDQSTVWLIDKPSRSEAHPTMKPIELCAKAIKNSSRRGEIVLDTFCGSGSTLIACEKMDRVCRAMEMDPVYCDVIIQRWEEFTGEKSKVLPTKKNGSK